MASLRYRDPTTGNWVLLNGGGEPTESQILFFKSKDDFPDVGDATKMYIDTSDSRTYIFTGIGYNLVGDGFAEDWEKTDKSDIDKMFE